MALNEDPVFSLDIVKEIDRTIDHKIKDLRRVPKPKDNEKTSEDSLKDFNIDDLKNFDPSKFDPSKFDPSKFDPS